MGITKVKQFFMAFIQYFSQAESESLVISFAPLLENYGMKILKNFNYSKQLYTESRILNNNFSKFNRLISWVNQTQMRYSIEIRSDEPFSENETYCRKVDSNIRQLIKHLNSSSKNE